MAYCKYKLGDLVEQYDEINLNGEFADIDDLQGINSNKYFQECKSNKNDIDLYRYRICRHGMFSYNRATSRNGEKISIALRTGGDCIVSPSYYCFRVKNEDILCPEYLDIWFKRPVFDRYARFNSWGSATEFFTFDDFCTTEIMLPPISEQRKIVHDYQVITDRIELLRKMNEKLEEFLFADFQRKFQNGKDAALKGTPLNGWKTCELAELTDFQYGKMVPENERSETGYPIFSGYGITGYYHEYMFEDPCIVVLARGVSGTGEVRISPKYSYITNLSIVLSLKDNDYFAYLYEYLAHDNLRALDSGSAQSMITIDSLNKYIVAVPSMDLAKEYNDAFSKMHVVIENNQNEIESLTRLSTVSLQHLVKGA